VKEVSEGRAILRLHGRSRVGHNAETFFRSGYVFISLNYLIKLVILSRRRKLLLAGDLRAISGEDSQGFHSFWENNSVILR